MKTNAPNPIELALKPLEDEAVRQTRERVDEKIKSAVKEVEASNGKLNEFVKYPSGWDADYRHKVARYKFFHSIFTPADRERRYIIDIDTKYVLDPKGVERLHKEAEEKSRFQYRAYLAKMNAKIGEVISADLKGTSLWNESFLTVVKSDNVTEIWKTRLVLNQSKYGLPFFQFPTRKVKHS